MELIYFAYGSNLYTPRLQQRVPSASFYKTATLLKHELRFHKHGADDSAKADAFYTGRDQDFVHGVLYRMAPTERHLLDRCEGGYDRREIEVSTHTGQVKAFSYFARPELLDESLQPFHWYKAYVYYGAKLHKLPPDYIAGIDELYAIADPDSVRSARHLKVLRLSLI